MLKPPKTTKKTCRHRWEELERPRTSGPTGMGMVEDEEESPHTKRRHRSPPLRQSHDAASAATDELVERLSALSGRIDTAVEFNTYLQAQTTISLLQSKLLENAAQEAVQAEILRAPREPRGHRSRRGLAQRRSSGRTARGRCSQDWKPSSMRAWRRLLRCNDTTPFPNGNIKINGGGGLVTPLSPMGRFLVADGNLIYAGDGPYRDSVNNYPIIYSILATGSRSPFGERVVPREYSDYT
ncbi:hypothetical protein PAXRUDRAFT_24212 [Paxillus rubicundulus Ve08.2h10]|uniref:Uncharacterized protein n=1 Tax=Paxillus rubicundulus Ve08.2h10 TaxID=930991 RepID=A0A0D0DJ65_9AGAM|nr:hypothetical protein PAXRUDRAFT_24212 [Paxillus rubicundulus Ve08.2h10]